MEEEIRPLAEKKTQCSISEDEYSKLSSFYKWHFSLVLAYFSPPPAHFSKKSQLLSFKYSGPSFTPLVTLPPMVGVADNECPQASL